MSVNGSSADRNKERSGARLARIMRDVVGRAADRAKDFGTNIFGKFFDLSTS